MSFASQREKVQQLINEYSELGGSEISISSNYAELQNAAAQLELQQELNKLNESLKEGKIKFKRKFKALCEEREKRNQNTCLSYFARHEGTCNRLYWEIAEILFAPKSFEKMLAILLPSTKQSLTVQFIPAKKISNTQMVLARNDLQDLKHPANIKIFSQLVFGESVIFDIEQLENLPFALQRKLYKQLSDGYPHLKKTLYEWNSDLKQLAANIELFEKKGLTPSEAISRLAHELTLSGTRYTARTYAAKSGEKAYKQFLVYLNHLPSQLNQTILGLKTSDNETFSDVMEKLSKGDCVETAASALNQILQNPANKSILETRPELSEEELKAIEKKYRQISIELDEKGESKTIPVELRPSVLKKIGKDESTTIPTELRQGVLKKINITSAFDYINLLTNLPVNEYVTFLEYVNIQCDPKLPPSLADAIAGNLFNDEQLQVFFESIAKHADKFGGAGKVMWFAAQSKKLKALEVVLNHFSEKDRLTALNERNAAGDNILHMTVQSGNSENLKKLLTLYPDDKTRIAAVNEKNNEGNTVLHRAAYNGNPDVAQEILTIFPDDQTRVATVHAKNKDGDTVLNSALQSRNPKMMEKILTSLPSEQARIAAIQEKNDTGLNLFFLSVIWQIPEIVLAILNSLSKKNRLEIMIGINNDGDAVLDFFPKYQGIGERIPGFLKILPAILDTLAEEDRLVAVNTKNSLDVSLLSLAVNNGDTKVVSAMLNLLPETDRFIAVKEKYYDSTILDIATKKGNAELALAILNSLPESDRVAAVNEKNNDNDTVLQLAINSKTELESDILKILPVANKNDETKVESIPLKTLNDTKIDTKIMLTIKKQVELYQTHLQKVIKESKPKSVRAKTKWDELEKIKISTLDNPQLSEQERLDEFSKQFNIYKITYVKPKIHKQEKKVIAKILHVLASIGTLGAYAGIRAIYSSKKKGSPQFWKTHKEILSDKINAAKIQYKKSPKSK